MSNSRYDLEQQIMDCWGICEDLGTVIEAVLENGLTEDQIANILQGMKDLYHLKFEKTFETYEKVLRENKTVS